MNIIDLNTKFNLCIVLHTCPGFAGGKLNLWRKLYHLSTKWIDENPNDVMLEEAVVFQPTCTQIRVRFSSPGSATIFCTLFDEYFEKYSLLFSYGDGGNHIDVGSLLSFRQDIDDLLKIGSGLKEFFPIKLSPNEISCVVFALLSEKMLYAYDEATGNFYFQCEREAIEAKLHF